MKNIFIILLFVCSKNTQAQINKTTVLLCNKQWQMVAYTVQPAMDYRNENNLINDLFKDEKTCKKDDYYVFKFNNTYTQYNAAEVCTHGETDIISKGTWVFSKTDAAILNTKKNGTGAYLQKRIIALTEKTFSFTTTIIKNKITYTFTETFEAIKTEKITL